MQPTNNAVRRDASPLECAGTFATGCQGQGNSGIAPAYSQAHRQSDISRCAVEASQRSSSTAHQWERSVVLRGRFVGLRGPRGRRCGCFPSRSSCTGCAGREWRGSRPGSDGRESAGSFCICSQPRGALAPPFSVSRPTATFPPLSQSGSLPHRNTSCEARLPPPSIQTVWQQSPS